MTLTFDWVWLLAGLTGLGGAGLIALYFFTPAAAAWIVNTIWSILQTRLGLALAVGLAGLYFGDFHRANVERIAAQKARADALAIQRHINDEIEQATRADADARLKAIQSKLDDRTKQVNEYEKKLSGNSCPVGADAGRLRAISK